MEEKKKRKKILKIINIIIYIIFFIILYVSLFINKRFDDISFEQLLYNVIDKEGANYLIVLYGALFVLLSLILTSIVIYLFYKVYILSKIKVFLKFTCKTRVKKIDLFEKTKIKSVLCLILFILCSLFCSIKLLNIDEYIKNQKNSSQLFEQYYVNAKEVELEFPDKKRNLIYIYAESMETTNFSVENGGLVETTYIPKLQELALKNINFSNTDKLGGAIQVKNTGWTIAALVAHTAGIPLKLSIDGNSYKNYGDSFPGVYNLGDILYDNGYNNYFMIGSDANFGGRSDYFKSHGNYTIYDYTYAKQKGLIDPDYYVWWGYEDAKLFKFAKEKILKASTQNEPFNFIILTVDTHFTDGYMDDSCEKKFETKYANSLYCSDSKIYSFVKWLQKQDFYDNTTIIISGDHLTMQNNFYKNKSNYERTVYNTIINSPINPEKEKNRLYSTLDMFPTTLAALGVKIEGNKLGLGVNLFSAEKTLLEEYGKEYINEEIMKKSFYYDNELLGDTYYKMMNE